MLKIGKDHAPRVVFLDDEQAFLDAIKTWAPANDLTFATTTAPTELQTLIQKERFDCIVCDLRMGDFPTVSFLEVVHHEHPNIECAVLTGFSPSAEEVTRLAKIRTHVHYKGEGIATFLKALGSRKEATTWLPQPLQSGAVRPTHPSAEYHSVFLSYGGPDEETARILYERLTEQGVDVFFFPQSAVPGQRLHRTMSDGVNSHDRVVLLCSERSLGRPGVLNELDQVLAREAQEGGTELLIPIALDAFVYAGWRPEREDLARQVSQRVIADFRDCRTDPEALTRGLAKLLAALRRRP